MSATLTSAGITFGDGTTQTTTTPTVISAFTNDSNYITTAVASSTYALKSQSANYFGFDTGFSCTIQLLNQSGSVIYGGFYNCNCNC